MTNFERERLEEFEKRFNRRHSQMTHIGSKVKAKDCPVCVEDRAKNPKGYYRTFLTEQRHYWTREMFDDVSAFISETIRLTREATLTEVIGVLGEHNARILNEFQKQGTADMPFVAYDERVCLVPAMDIATKETLQRIEALKGEKTNPENV